MLLTKVRRLTLAGTRVTVAGVRRLGDLPSLRKLDLAVGGADPATLVEALAALPGLERLVLRVPLGESLVEQLRRRLPGCEISVIARSQDPFGRSLDLVDVGAGRDGGGWAGLGEGTGGGGRGRNGNDR